MKTVEQWLNELGNGTAQAYPNIARNDMVTGLRMRLASPVRIDQANTSLCGAACLMYCLASLRPAVYAQYIVELYHSGKSTLGRLSVEPGSDCRKYKPSATKGIHPVDWVALASLRDSENDFFDYDEPSDEIGGITMPGDLVDWFKDSGFGKDANFTNFVFTKDEGCIRALGNRYRQQHSVCLFINANLINHASEGSWIPDHWVVLVSPVVIDKKRVALSVYTWGRIMRIDLAPDVFCRNFYGYISSLAT